MFAYVVCESNVIPLMLAAAIGKISCIDPLECVLSCLIEIIYIFQSCEICWEFGSFAGLNYIKSDFSIKLDKIRKRACLDLKSESLGRCNLIGIGIEHHEWNTSVKVSEHLMLNWYTHQLASSWVISEGKFNVSQVSHLPRLESKN